MNQKVTPESFKAYRDWGRYILKAKPKLGRGHTKATLIAYCFAMASHGTNGLGCYASDGVIAEELGMYDFRSVLPYRNEALRLGWFVWNGERRGRAKVLDIAIPADDETSINVDVPAVTETPRVSADGHVPGNLVDCPACQEHWRNVERGYADPDVQAWEIHKQALGRLCV